MVARAASIILLMRKTVWVRKRPVGLEEWTCEFVLRRSGSAYSGADACWTDGGSADNVRRATGLSQMRR